MSNLLFKRWNDFGGWLVFLIAAFVYGMKRPEDYYDSVFLISNWIKM